MTIEEIEAALSTNKQVAEGTIPQRENNTVSRGGAPSFTVSGTEMQKMAQYDAAISGYDQQVFGSLTEEQRKSMEKTGWDAQKAYKEMSNRKMKEGIADSKIPTAILESFAKNPLDSHYEDEDINNFVNGIVVKNENIDAALEINKRMETITSRNGVITEEVRKPQPVQGATIDESMLESIIERVLDKKLGQLQNSLLTESVRANNNGLKAFKMTSEGKFLFVDSEDNVYECALRYKGKNKARK